MKMPKLNSRARKVLQGRSRGFSLIEVVIAIALLGIIGTAILSALSTASLALIIADKRATAESLARTQMESIKSQNYTAANQSPWQVLYQRIGGLPTGYLICSLNWATNQTDNCGNTTSMSIIAVAWNSTTNQRATGETGLQKIKLFIKQGVEVVVTLEDYKRKP